MILSAAFIDRLRWELAGNTIKEVECSAYFRKGRPNLASSHTISITKNDRKILARFIADVKSEKLVLTGQLLAPFIDEEFIRIISTHCRTLEISGNKKEYQFYVHERNLPVLANFNNLTVPSLKLNPES
ncbi:hypothetical protein PMAYCL1PPCAC_14645, partial [Pristionchus mayeri]